MKECDKTDPDPSYIFSTGQDLHPQNLRPLLNTVLEQRSLRMTGRDDYTMFDREEQSPL